jgi:hypothetical protein
MVVSRKEEKVSSKEKTFRYAEWIQGHPFLTRRMNPEEFQVRAMGILRMKKSGCQPGACMGVREKNPGCGIVRYPVSRSTEALLHPGKVRAGIPFCMR